MKRFIYSIAIVFALLGIVIAQDAYWVVTDHGELSGLADDDHLQYLRADGTRQSTGDVGIQFGTLQTVWPFKFADGDTGLRFNYITYAFEYVVNNQVVNSHNFMTKEYWVDAGLTVTGELKSNGGVVSFKSRSIPWLGAEGYGGLWTTDSKLYFRNDTGAIRQIAEIDYVDTADAARVEVVHLDTTPTDPITGENWQTIKTYTVPGGTLGSGGTVLLATLNLRRTSGSGQATFRMMYGTSVVVTSDFNVSKNQHSVYFYLQSAGSDTTQRGYIAGLQAHTGTGASSENSAQNLAWTFQIDLITDEDEYVADTLIVEVLKVP